MAHGKASGNDSAAFGYPPSSSFPQYKAVMPNDQVAKLLAMHRESTANAGIYVAVVLAVYVALLSLLLCRYVRRRPREPPSMIPHQTTHHSALYNCPCPIANCLRKPVGFISALRHCSFKGADAGVSSISSNSNHDPIVEEASHPLNPVPCTSVELPPEVSQQSHNPDSIVKV